MCNVNFEKMYSTIDTHIVGEAFRIFIQSPILLDGIGHEFSQEYLLNKYQNEKMLLLNEPRGHRDLQGCVITSSKKADYKLLFLNHDHDIQFNYGALVTSLTALLETGMLERKTNEIYYIETSNGIHSVRAKVVNQEVVSVYLESKECRVKERHGDFSLVEVDGERIYLIFSLPDSIPGIYLDHLSLINQWFKEIINKLNQVRINFDGIILTEQSDDSPNNVRSVTFRRDGTIVRSPGYDSTFALFTLLLEDTKRYKEFKNQSIFNSELIARIIENTNYRFAIEAEGFITGFHHFIYDYDDPLKNGFLLK